MIQMKDKVKLIQDSALQGVVELQNRAMSVAVRAAGFSQKTRQVLTLTMVFGAFGVNSGIAWAAKQDCGGEAGSKLVTFIDGVAEFAMILAGGLAILMFVIGALYIIVGSKQSNVSKGIGFIKNAAIGLGVVILAFFIRTLIEAFSSGLGQGEADQKCTDKANSVIDG